MGSTPQRIHEKGVQLHSVVCRIFDAEGKEHLHIGLVLDPEIWAQEIRWKVDNPLLIEAIEEIEEKP